MIDNAVSDVTITNTGSTVAFFVRVDLRRGDRGGSEPPGDNEVLPVSYSDNDITLWPGESQTIQVAYDSSKLAGATAVDSVFAWNVPYRDVASPSTWPGRSPQRDAARQPGVTSFGLADGTPQQTGSARPGQANRRSVMVQLRERVSTAR